MTGVQTCALPICGRVTYCIRCATIRVKAHSAHAANIKETNKLLAAHGLKTCPRCRATKSLDLFRDDRGHVRRACVPCRKYMMEHTRGRRAKWTPERRAKANEVSRGQKDLINFTNITVKISIATLLENYLVGF